MNTMLLEKMAVMACAFMMLGVVSGGCGEKGDDEEKKGKDPKDAIAVIETEKGTMKFKFYPEEAPNTVANFIKLAESGFYDGLTFHRVIANFMIQGGCPKGTGTGGPGYSIDAEFNDIKHVEGTVAMARSADPDSAGSQFYICHGDTPHLDGKYTVFGQVIEGVEVVHKIRKGDKMIKVYIE